MILAGDVGGTKTLLGLFKRQAGKLVVVREASLPSQEFDSFAAMLERFLAAGRQRVTRAAIGVAGPVVDGVTQVVNLRWPVDARRLSGKFGFEIRVINDVEATGWGIPELPARKTLNLTPGLRSRPGNAALIAAGTGLGMALLLWDGRRHHACSSEGGHQGFAPRDDLDTEMLAFTRARLGRVSVERFVSGPGISAIYEFLVQSGRCRESAAMKRRLADAFDDNAAVAEAGLAGKDAAASMALQRFVSLYGAAAGDLALVAKAIGGVYVGGGIAPRILPALRGGDFLRAFRDKGRLTPLLKKIPLRVILEPKTALIGAAACAERSRPETNPSQAKR